jgi:hypothetical protein
MNRINKFNLLIAILIFSYNFSLGQNSKDKTCYKAPGIYLVVKDKEGVIKSTVPMGKNIVIYYDHFYKSYHLIYEFKDGITEMKLNYIQDYDAKIVKMVDEIDEIYYVEDYLASNGTLNMLKVKEISGLIGVLSISNAVMCKN